MRGRMVLLLPRTKLIEQLIRIDVRYFAGGPERAAALQFVIDSGVRVQLRDELRPLVLAELVYLRVKLFSRACHAGV